MNTVTSHPAPARRVSALALVLPTLLCLAACKEEGGGRVDAGTDATAASRRALLTATGGCVLTSAREFLTAATALETAAAAHAAQPDATTRDAARAAFHDAMDRWQVLEVMQLGPAAPRNLPGGAELRDNIYSWPLVSRCAVEEQVVSKGYEAEGFPTSLVSRRGLSALEYLLFFEGADTACPSTSPIVSQGTWAELSQEERAARKRAYAVVAATNVRNRATQLVEAWEADKGGFSRTLETAGSGNAIYPTSQAALNSVSDALFYLEREVKDMKLARPLGLRDCTTASCPELLESRFAKRSKANVRANLRGFRRIVQGCGASYEGTGFDDLLESSGAGALAGRLRERMDAAEAGIAAVKETDLEVALAQDKASVRAMYDAIKGVTDALKTEVVTTLDLELPQSVEGDND